MAGESAVIVVADAEAAGRAAAHIVTETVRGKPEAALAVPTGSTPLPMFAELIARVRRGELDLSRVHLFCLDEYVGVATMDPVSLTGWLSRLFFIPAGIPVSHVRTLPSTDPDPAAGLRAYEADLAARGGLDLAVLGLGANGHIAYNEPGSAADSRTRVLTLTPESVTQAAGYFAGRTVPTQAMTIGVGTLLEAHRIVLIVTGAGKTAILRRTLSEPMCADVPASWLRLAGNRLTVIADEAAAGQ
jgi:glucosamine-6-phosphate deaminase